MALLDTTVLIDLTHGGQTERSRRAYAAVDGLLGRGETVMTSRINEAELRVGEFRADDPDRQARKNERVLNSCEIVELDAAAARRFAEVKAHLLDLGRPVGDMDILIGAIACVRSQTLLTRNPRHFADIPGLVVEGY